MVSAKVKRFLESMPGLPVDFLDRRQEGFQRLFQVFILLIKINFAFALRLELIDGGKIDGP